jgi:tetratricopeptide (TPR) repeat protein
MPPLPRVFDSCLDLERVTGEKTLRDALVAIEEMDLDAELAKLDAADGGGDRTDEETANVRTVLELTRAVRTLARGDEAAGMAELALVIAEHPTYADAYAVRASFHARGGDLDAALADLDRAVELEPRSAPRYLARAQHFERAQDHDRALANFRRAAQLDRASTAAHAGAGRCHAAKGDHRAAIRAYGNAIKLAPNEPSHYFVRAVMHEAAGHAERALADYDRSIALLEPQTDAWLGRGRCRLRLGKNDAALADFTRVIQMRPAEGLAYRSRADALLGLERYDEALPDLDRAIELDAPGAPGASHWMRGRVLERQGDLERALADFDEAVTRGPDQLAFLASRFALRVKRGDVAGFLADVDKLVELAPDSTGVRHTHARLHAAHGSRDVARASYDRLIALDDTLPQAFHERAALLVGKGDTMAANEDYARAYALAPDDPEILASYGRSRAMGSPEDREAAFEHIAASARLDPDNADAWARAGSHLRCVGAHARAIAHMNRAIELDPLNPDFYEERACAFQGVFPGTWVDPGGRSAPQAALDDIERAITLTEDDDVNLYLRRAELREEVGDLAGAIADYTTIIALDPDLIDGHLERARVRAETGDLAGARIDARRAKALEDEHIREISEALPDVVIQRATSQIAHLVDGP